MCHAVRPMPLSPDDLRKLIAICGRFGSSFDGERAAAAHLAHQLLSRHQLTWEQVLQPALPAPPAAARSGWEWEAAERERRYEEARQRAWARERERATPKRTWRDCATACALQGDDLSEWEETFLASILRRRSGLTTRQAEVLRGIAERLGAVAWD